VEDGRRWAPNIERDLLLIATPYVVVVAVGLSILTSGLYLLHGARASVTGEGHYSKAQKRAVFHLLRYAATGEPAEWEAYESQIEIPQSAGRALAALQREPVGWERASDELRRAGIDEDDVPGILRLFAWARWMPEIQASLRAWEDADKELTRLDGIARSIRADLESEAPSAEHVASLLAEAAAVDAVLGELADQFSAGLRAGSLRLRTYVLTVTWVAAALMLLIGALAWIRMMGSARRGKQSFQAMIERAHDIITILDAEGLTIYNSPSVETVLGHSPEDLEGRSCLDLIHPDDRQRVQEILGVAIRESAAVEYQFECKDGSWKTLSSRGGPFPLPDGRPGIVVNSRDVSDRRQLEHRLVQAERMESIGRLAGGVAHDFNNLITVIASSVSLAKQEPDLNPDLRDDLDIVGEACGRAAQLTAQLLTFARREVAEPTPLDVDAVLADLAPMLKRLFDTSIDLVLVPGQGISLVKADRAQLDRLFVNLTINAAEAMPDGGTLTIATRRVHRGPDEVADGLGLPEGDYVRIDVSDTGVAMSDEVQAHVFEPFFTTKTDGTGLGLSTCYGIVRQNGGAINVEAEPGKGTRFWILWPLVGDAELCSDGRADSAGDPVGATILYAEDEPPLRRVVSRLLRRAGYRVIVAADGPEALRMAADEPTVDLLLTDVTMPGMTGRELAERLQAERPEVPVVFMSGYTEDSVLREQIGARHVHFVAKPFDPETLQERLGRILEESRGGRRAS